MVALFLAVAPTLLIVSLAGYGAVVRAVFVRGSRDQSQEWDLFECAFAGIFLITAGALAANFFIELGINPGPYVLTTGVALFVFFKLWNKISLTQLILVIFVVSIISAKLRYIPLGYDGGLYHIPSMNWVAYEPAPLGLANLETRLGFDSAWLLFESALRAERFLKWSHLSVAEIAIRALVLGWVLRQFLMEVASGWHAKSLVFLSAVLAISPFIFRTSTTSTDIAANMLAFCAWVLFCKLMLAADTEAAANKGWEFALLLILVALAVTFKLSMLPVALLLPMLLLRASVRQTTVLFVSRNFFLITLFYCVLWLARNLVLTGCIVYPVSVTCLSVPWAVGAANAKIDAARITGWARHPGPDALEFLGVSNTNWIPAWFNNVRGSVELELVVATVSLIALSYVLVERRDRSPLIRNSRRLVAASMGCAASGLVLWFLAAPDVRFAWSFFAILSATLIFHGLCEFDFALPKIHLKPLRLRVFLTWSVVLAATAAIIQLKSGSLVPLEAPMPSFKIATVSANWQIYMPATGNQCWALFPCTPHDFGAKSVESWHNRLFFRSNIWQR